MKIMSHLSSPHKWPLKAIVIPRAKPEGYNWSFLGSRVVTKFHWSRVRTRQMSLFSFFKPLVKDTIQVFRIKDFGKKSWNEMGYYKNWRPILLVVDFQSIRFHFTNFFINISAKIDDQFHWSWIFIVSDFISRIFFMDF